jgi:hypothetical protein
MKEIYVKNSQGLEGIKLRFVAVINAINTVIDQIIFLHDSVTKPILNNQVSAEIIEHVENMMTVLVTITKEYDQVAPQMDVVDKDLIDYTH